MDSKIIKYILILVLFCFKVSALEFNGKFIQGHFILGKTDPGSQVFIDKIFDTIWVDGLNLNDETILKKILNTLDVVPDIFLSEAESIDIKNKLK